MQLRQKQGAMTRLRSKKGAITGNKQKRSAEIQVYDKNHTC